jgi:hypothetical protein
VQAVTGRFVSALGLCGVFVGLWLRKRPGDIGGAVAVPAVVVAFLGFGVILLQAYRSCVDYGESPA